MKGKKEKFSSEIKEGEIKKRLKFKRILINNLKIKSKILQLGTKNGKKLKKFQIEIQEGFNNHNQKNLSRDKFNIQEINQKKIFIHPQKTSPFNSNKIKTKSILKTETLLYEINNKNNEEHKLNMNLNRKQKRLNQKNKTIDKTRLFNYFPLSNLMKKINEKKTQQYSYKSPIMNESLFRKTNNPTDKNISKQDFVIRKIILEKESAKRFEKYKTHLPSSLKRCSSSKKLLTSYNEFEEEKKKKKICENRVFLKNNNDKILLCKNREINLTFLKKLFFEEKKINSIPIKIQV